MNQKSFAEVAELLSKKESKYQKMLDSAISKRDKNTAQRMLDRVTQSKEALIEDNRAIAEEKNPTAPVPEFGWGGDLLNMLKGASGGGDDFDAAFAAAGGNDPSRIVDLGIIKGQKDGGILSKLGGLFKNSGGASGLFNKALGVAGKVAPFADNLAMGKYINNVRPDSMPEMTTAPMLNTEYNINPQLVEAKNSARVFDKSMDGSATNRSTARNGKIAGHVGRLNALNSIYGQKSNIESQLKNQAARAYSNTQNTNAGLRTQHRQNLVDFNNQKEYMKYANILNASEDVGNINSQRIEQQNQQKMLDVLRPYFNRFGLMDKYASQYSKKGN